jgi:hypothetical protein
MSQKAKPQVHDCECPICGAATDQELMEHHAQINRFLSRLTEPQRRWYAGLLSQAPSSPSDRQLALITGLDKKTIQRGRRELTEGFPELPAARARRAGGGRPAAEKKTRP